MLGTRELSAAYAAKETVYNYIMAQFMWPNQKVGQGTDGKYYKLNTFGLPEKTEL